jgi:hypothetical protein
MTLLARSKPVYDLQQDDALHQAGRDQNRKRRPTYSMKRHTSGKRMQHCDRSYERHMTKYLKMPSPERFYSTGNQKER